jgi:hypothetical protein
VRHVLQVVRLLLRLRIHLDFFLYRTQLVKPNLVCINPNLVCINPTLVCMIIRLCLKFLQLQSLLFLVDVFKLPVTPTHLPAVSQFCSETKNYIIIGQGKHHSIPRKNRKKLEVPRLSTLN